MADRHMEGTAEDLEDGEVASRLGRRVSRAAAAHS